MSVSPVVFLALAAACARAQTVSLSAATSSGDVTDLSQIISPSYAGMGIEPSNLYSFTGGEYNPNTLSINLLTNLANYTGVPPHLRIGGNTADNMIYDSSYEDYVVQYNANATGNGNDPSNEFTFGPKYFEVLDRFPKNTPITYGLNLAYDGSDYITNIVNEATAAITLLKDVTVVGFEIGNEPDLYLQNGFRTGTWNASIYAEQWRERAVAVYDQVLEPHGYSTDFFEPGCTASTIGTTFQILQLSETEISEAVNGTSNATFVAGWNQHDYYYYIGVSSYTLTLDYMMNLATTYSQFADWSRQVQEALATGKPFYLREMSSVGPIGETGISDVFGATLWTLNFFLYTATLNISSVQLHMTDDSLASPWLPIPYYNHTPYVRTTYYAWAAFAQLVGNGCTTRVASLSIASYPEGYSSGRLTAYASYQNDALSSVVLLNTNQANASSTDKGTATFNLSMPAYAGKVFHISYLTNNGSDSYYNTTWNGLSYEISGDGSPTTVDSTDYTITVGSDGTLAVPVRDSQAVIANLGSKLGSVMESGSAASSACAALASNIQEGSEAIPSAAYSYTASLATGTTTVPISATGTGSSDKAASTSKGAAGPVVTPMPGRVAAGVVALGALVGGVAIFV